MSDDPIITPVTDLNALGITFEPTKRGIKPYKLDDRHIQAAIVGRDSGRFATAGQAAYAITNEYLGREHKEYDSTRSRLRRRLKQYFST